jgi:PAS domain S-box-containing protein
MDRPLPSVREAGGVDDLAPSGGGAMTDESAARLEAELFAKAADAMVIADRDGSILSWNAGAEAMFGYPAAEAIGASLDLIVPERLRERHWAGYKATMQTGHTSYGDRLLAVPAARRDGTRLSIEFRVTLLGEEDGRPVAIGAVIRDVTQRWAEERRLRERLAQLEDKQQSGGTEQHP